jgi:hypothetical protein
MFMIELKVFGGCRLNRQRLGLSLSTAAGLAGEWKCSDGWIQWLSRAQLSQHFEISNAERKLLFAVTSTGS